jgi:hypothetical protein
MNTQGTKTTHIPPARRDFPPIRLRPMPFPPPDRHDFGGQIREPRETIQNDFLVMNQRPDLLG